MDSRFLRIYLEMLINQSVSRQLEITVKLPIAIMEFHD